MVAHKHFYEDFMTFVFDNKFLQGMEPSSRKFNKPPVVILLQQSKKTFIFIFVQTQIELTGQKSFTTHF